MTVLNLLVWLGVIALGSYLLAALVFVATLVAAALVSRWRGQP